jgi:hypothetical protein
MLMKSLLRFLARLAIFLLGRLHATVRRDGAQAVLAPIIGKDELDVGR